MNSFIKIASTGLMLCSLGHLVAQKTGPRDAVYEQTSISERPTLAYTPLREADVMWEDWVWRDIKPEEKMNAHFTHPTSSLFWCLFKLSDSSNIHLYKTDEFKEEFKEHNRLTVWTEIDTILFYDPEILNEVEQIVYTEPNSFGTLRLKEVWFFDEQHSTMSVRILGIAPMEENYDDKGNALFSYARCWFYYPEIRPYLSHCIAYTSDNDSDNLTWEEVLEMRLFSSTIIKSSDISDKNLALHYADNRNRLLAAERIHSSIFDLEQSVWQY